MQAAAKPLEPDQAGRDEREITATEVENLQEIGRGTTATVYKAVVRGATVAVKEIHLIADDKDLAIVQAAQRELRVLSKCAHPNIVRLIGLVVEKMPIRLILEYCAGGSLFDLLHNHTEVEICWEQRFKALHDTASAEDYLHNFHPPIIHRDLKSLNLMLLQPVHDSKTLPHIKLADFGFARLQASHMTSGVGTKHWMAPEVLEGTEYTTKADVFSFAMLAFEVAFRTVPFAEFNPHDVARKTMNGERPDFDDPDLEGAEMIPQEIVDLIKICWDQDPTSRPDFRYIRNEIAQATLQARGTTR